MNIVNGKKQYTLLGKGQAPVFEGIDALTKGDIKVILVLNGKSYGILKFLNLKLHLQIF